MEVAGFELKHLNQLAKPYNLSVMNGTQLNLVFSALADPTRRGMLEQLSKGEVNAGTLAKPYAISQPAASKHLRVLEKAGLIRRTRQGREHLIKVDPRPIEAARDWIALYARFWQQQFDAVDTYLKEHSQKSTRSQSKGTKS